MQLLALLFISFLTPHLPALASDQIVSSSSYFETAACTGPGYCYGYGHNPVSGQYEYYYGYHQTCSGEQMRRVEEITWRRQDGSTYQTKNYGIWSQCRIN